jgi:hypothetical protein
MSDQELDPVIAGMVRRMQPLIDKITSNMMALEIVYGVTFARLQYWDYRMVFKDGQHVDFRAGTVDWTHLFRVAEFWSARMYREAKNGE